MANIAAGAMTFGQFLSERSFSVAVAVVGLTVWAILTGWALFFVPGE